MQIQEWLVYMFFGPLVPRYFSWHSGCIANFSQDWKLSMQPFLMLTFLGVEMKADIYRFQKLHFWKNVFTWMEKKKPKPTNQTKWTTTNWPITNHSVILDVAQVQDFALGFVVGFVEVLLHPLLKPVSVSLNGIWFLELVDNWSLPSTSFHYLYCNKIFWQYKALTFSINPVGDSWH